MLGERISALRKNRGLSQELLAENARTSLRTIQRIEKGITAPRPYTLKTIADALGVSVDTLLPNAAEQGANAIPPEELKWLTLLNTVCLVGLVLPIANIVLPLLVWKKHRAFFLVNLSGKRIISFQILWTITTAMVLVASQLIQLSITGSVAVGRFPLLWLVYFMMLALNLFFILRTAVKMKSDVRSILFFVPVIF